LQQQVLHLQKEFKVNFDKSLMQEIKDGKPDISLYWLAEKEIIFYFTYIFLQRICDDGQRNEMKW
jgi:hypothetical protein